MDSISLNSLDAVSDRDPAIEAVSSLAILMMHISRLAEEICPVQGAADAQGDVGEHPRLQRRPAPAVSKPGQSSQRVEPGFLTLSYSADGRD